jgi:hypothetical protein
MNSNKNKEEKKYVQLSPDSVCHLAESVGLSNLNPVVARALAEDASYRCRELASVSYSFLFSFSGSKVQVFKRSFLICWKTHY